jgi:hypothetical protein
MHLGRRNEECRLVLLLHTLLKQRLYHMDLNEGVMTYERAE